jgi:N-acyl-D-aspartate/D-glutamate deacylase
LGLEDRGWLAAGCRADVVVFDPETIRDRSTFEQPVAFPDGVEWVIVNGRIAVKPGEDRPARVGRVLA